MGSGTNLDIAATDQIRPIAITTTSGVNEYLKSSLNRISLTPLQPRSGAMFIDKNIKTFLFNSVRSERLEAIDQRCVRTASGSDRIKP